MKESEESKFARQLEAKKRAEEKGKRPITDPHANALFDESEKIRKRLKKKNFPFNLPLSDEDDAAESPKSPEKEK